MLLRWEEEGGGSFEPPDLPPAAAVPRACAWGRDFPHLFLMAHGPDVFPRLVASGGRRGPGREEGDAGSSKDETVEAGDESLPPLGGRRPLPSVFGFRVHPEAARARYPLLLFSGDGHVGTTGGG